MVAVREQMCAGSLGRVPLGVADPELLRGFLPERSVAVGVGEGGHPWERMHWEKASGPFDARPLGEDEPTRATPGPAELLVQAATSSAMVATTATNTLPWCRPTLLPWRGCIAAGVAARKAWHLAVMTPALATRRLRTDMARSFVDRMPTSRPT